MFLVIKNNTCNWTKNSSALSFFAIVTKIWIATWSCSVLLLLGGDVELNPGPKTEFYQGFFNLSYIVIICLKAYIAIHRFDIICISETYLDSSTSLDDNNLEIFGYTLIQSDHPSKNKRGGICIYYKHFLHLRKYSQCSIFANFVSLYRS